MPFQQPDFINVLASELIFDIPGVQNSSDFYTYNVTVQGDNKLLVQV